MPKLLSTTRKEKIMLIKLVFLKAKLYLSNKKIKFKPGNP